MAGLAEIPCIVRQLTDDEATIIMVDSNLQREQILPSEKAFAYKMKLDAMKRQGQRTDLTSSPLDNKLKGVTAAQQISRDSGDSQPQIYRYIRLTHLIRKSWSWWITRFSKTRKMLQIAMRPAVELSYLRKEEQPTCSLSWTRWTAPHPTPRPSKCARCPKPRLEGNGWPKNALVSIMKRKSPSKRTVQNPKRKNQPVFCAGDAHAEDRGHHC